MARFTQEEIAAAAKEALGRKGKAASDEALYDMYKDYKGDLSSLKANFAQSAEAQSRGIDATKYGGTYVDRNTLDDAGKAKYDAYQRGYGKNAKMTTAMFERYRDMNPELIESEGRGDVKVYNNNGIRTLEVSADAWNKFGSKLFSNMHSNEAVYIRKDGKIKDGSSIAATGKSVSKRWNLVGGENADDKYFILQKAQAKKSGVVGSIAKGVGLGEGLANSLDKAIGHAALPAAGLMTLAGQGWALPLADEAAAIGGGSRGADAYSRMGSDLLRSAGMTKENAAKTFAYANAIGDVATQIGAGFADSVTFGAASAANTGVEAYSRSAAGEEVDWEEVGKNIATSWASYGIGKGLDNASTAAGAWKSAKAASAVRGLNLAWDLGGREVASELARGGNAEDIAWAAGRDLVNSILPDYAGVKEAAALSMSYANAKRKGADDEGALFSASMAAAGQASVQRLAAGRPQGFMEKVKAIGTEGRSILEAAGGNMPAEWTAQANAAGKYSPAQIAAADREKRLNETIKAFSVDRDYLPLPKKQGPTPAELYLREGIGPSKVKGA